MAPIGIALALGLALFALSGAGSKGPTAPAGPKPLDPGMPPELDAKVRALLKTSTRPEDLESLAAIMDARGYRNTAAALRARAAQLRGDVSVPTVPLPPGSGSPTAPTPGPTPPILGPTTPPGPGLPPIVSDPWPTDPGTTPPSKTTTPPILPPIPPIAPPPPIEDIDPNIPPELARAVAAILAKPDLTDQELAAAEQLASRCEQLGYVRAGAKLRAKTLAIRASHAGSLLLQQIATLITAPGTLPPVSVQLPGVPPIVVGPGGGPAPTIPIPVSPPAGPSSPLAKTYKVAPGDNPSKIAQRFTGSSSATRVRELAAANPDKSSKILAGQLSIGETLTIPDAWPAKPTFPETTPTSPPPPTPAPSTAVHATIQKGSIGPDVALWQTLIGVKADGIFGPNTEAATKTWQAAHGVTADGIVGPVTWAKAIGLVVASTAPTIPIPGGIPGVPPVVVSIPSVPIPPVPVPPAPTAPPPVPPSTHAQISLGSTGPDVVAWQKIVGVPSDGKFGPQTQAATRAWQGAHGLAADGIVGPKTWAAAFGTSSASAGDVYVVVPGDTPFKIARRFTGEGSRFVDLAATNPAKAQRIAQGTLEHGESLHLPIHWPRTAGAYEPDSAAGVMDIIGASHHGHHHNGLGSHRYHG